MSYIYTTAGAVGPLSIGTTYTMTGSNGSSYADFSITAAAPPLTASSGVLTLSGKNADININGQSLNETLATIQSMLGVLQCNQQLEKEFDELKAAGDRYRELEQKFKEQKQVWDTLKDQNI